MHHVQAPDTYRYIAVRNLQQSSRLFARLFGTSEEHSEEVAEQKVRASFFRIGDSGVELLEPTSPDSPIASLLRSGGKECTISRLRLKISTRK